MHQFALCLQLYDGVHTVCPYSHLLCVPSTVIACRNLTSAGFTPEERESFERLLLQKGFKDVFRERHPEVEAYTYDMSLLHK